MRISRKANFFNQPVITILRLLLQLQEAKNIARSRDQRVVELQLEADQLREQAARQNSIVSSLKKRIQVVPSPTIYILLFFLSLFILKLYYTYYSTNRIEKLAPRIITNFSLLLNRQKKTFRNQRSERGIFTPPKGGARSRCKACNETRGITRKRFENARRGYGNWSRRHWTRGNRRSGPVPVFRFFTFPY